MSFNAASRRTPNLSAFMTGGLFWLCVAAVGAAVFFRDGLMALFTAWQTPEYSHGPIIPVLSLLMFLREMRAVPVEPGPKRIRWPGVIVVALALSFGLLGTLANINDIVAYALIFWVAGMLLISWGWRDGLTFWPSVLHLVYMLPLPGVLYYKISALLQIWSSEIGVGLLKLLAVPVFLDGNIIDLGVTKLHVAEACSGLRYMFPIMSFSYVFAVLYRGPWWHKAVLLLSAVPIAIVMNSVRIAVAGIIVQYYGNDWLEGFTHFFEGWVVFLLCIILLFALAWVMVRLRSDRVTLGESLDLELDNVMPQLSRLQWVRPSASLIIAALMGVVGAAGLLSLPDRTGLAPERDSFALFPRRVAGWEQLGPRQSLDDQVASVLAADDYHQVTLGHAGQDVTVGLFMAWYNDQSAGGVHSPEICLPGAGWEIAMLERTDMSDRVPGVEDFQINRAIIQKGETRMMVYYWFQQKQRRIAWDFAAKFWLLVDGITTGRTDGALIRLTSLIKPGESAEAAEQRLLEVLQGLQQPLPRFIPDK